MSAKRFCTSVCLFQESKRCDEAEIKHIRVIIVINSMKLIKDKL